MKREIVFASSGPCARGAQEGRTWGVTAINKEQGVDGRKAGAKAGKQEGSGWVCRAVHGLSYQNAGLRVCLMVVGP